MMVQLKIFVTTVLRQYAISSNRTLNFEFGSFPGPVIRGPLLPRDPGPWQRRFYPAASFR